MSFEYLTNIPLEQAKKDYLALLRENGFGPQTETVTVPEGKTCSATAELVDAATNGRISADDFMKCVNNAADYQADYKFLKDV